MGDFSSSSSIKKYNSFGNTSAITTASARKDIQYKNSKDTNEILHYGTVKGEDVVETFAFGNAAVGTYSNVHAEFKVSDTASYNIADLIKGSFTDSEGNSYSLYGSDSDNEQLKAVVDWLRDEVEERYNPSHSSQFYQFTSDEQMEKYVCEIIGVDDTNREALIESFKLNNASQLKEGEYTYSEVFAGVIQNKMLEAYQTYQSEIFEEDAAKYKHFEEQYLLKQLDQMKVIYSDYAGFDISTLSDEEKIKWFYKFIDNEAKQDFANDEYKERFNEAETNAEKENIFAENCMYLAAVKMAEIDEQRFQDSLTSLEKVGGVVYETGKRIGENFSTLWNSSNLFDALEYMVTDGTLQFFNDVGDGFVTLGGYAVKGVGHALVDDDALWDECVGETVYSLNEGNIADMMLDLRKEYDSRFQFADDEYLQLYYSARQLGSDSEMMLLNIFGAPELALPVSILNATGKQYNSAIAQGSGYADAIDYATGSGTFDGTVNYLFQKTIGKNPGTALIVANTAASFSQPIVNSFFKAATFSDDSFTEVVKKDKAVENGCVSAGTSLMMMYASSKFAQTELGKRFKAVTDRTKKATSMKNLTPTFYNFKSNTVEKLYKRDASLYAKFNARKIKNGKDVDFTRLNSLDANTKNNRLVALVDELSVDETKTLLMSTAKKYGIKSSTIQKHFDLMNGDIKYDKSKQITAEQIKAYKNSPDYFPGMTDEMIKEQILLDMDLSTDQKSAMAATLVTIEEYKRRCDSGYYNVSLDQVYNEKMKAYESIWSNNPYVPAQKHFGSDISTDPASAVGKYDKYFPATDYFVSDEAVMGYMKSIVSGDSDLVEQFKSCGTIDEMGAFLETHQNELEIKTYTFQDATTGANNLATFKNVGKTFDLRKGGLYALTSGDFEKNSSIYPTVYDASGGNIKVYDMERFGKDVLSGVPLSNENGAYMIETIVPLNDMTSQNVSMPSVANQSAYLNYFISGGELGSRCGEIVCRGASIPDMDFFTTSINTDGMFSFKFDASGITYNITKVN